MTVDKRVVISALLSSISDEIATHEYGDGLLVDLPLTYSDGDSIRLLVEPMGSGARVSDQASAYERLLMTDVNPDPGRVAEAISATIRTAGLSNVGGESDELATFGPLGDLGAMVLSVAQAAMRVEQLHRPCDHQDPKRLAHRPHDLAVICACGAEVMPGFRVRRQTEQELSFMADIQATFVEPLARVAGEPDAEPERPAGWCPTCEGRPRRVPE